MKTGLLAGHHLLLLHRATINLNLSPNWSTFQAVLVHRAPPQAHVHNSAPKCAAFPIEALHDEDVMFGRAVQAKAAEANNNKPKPGASSINNNASLKQQFFPSSSPARAPSAASQSRTSVADMFKKPGFSGTSSGAISASSRPSATSGPLTTRPANSPPRPLPNYGGSSKALASLYNASDSFNDTPDVTHLTMQTTKRPQHDLTSSVYIEDDDFSDDENLDLDFEAPSALPVLPTGRMSLEQHRVQRQQEEEAKEVRFREPPPGTHTSVLSWSESSPSHLQPPKRELNPPPNTNTKRDRLQDDDFDLDPPAAVKKPKRELPWPREPEPKEEEWKHTEEYIQEKSGYAPTPESKPEGSMLWNTTASAVKEQKKQLKDRQKSSSVAPKTEIPMDEIKKVVSSHLSKASAITLSGEQLHVKSLVVEKGQSVFFTGPAGTGKSVLMRAIISELKKKFAREPERVAVTASTGLAACNIGGMTLHSFAGIGLGKEDVQTLVKKIRRNQKAKTRWLKTKVLIIDEISMVDGELFDKLSQIGRVIRNNGRPWGGIQLVITGDFFQLPPVPDKDLNKQRDVKFAFDAATWNMSIDHTIGLTEVFRQRDPEFAEMLNEMRLGRISDTTVKNFQQLSRPLAFDDGLEVTELFPTRNEVENSNRQRLAALKGKVYRYEAYDTGEAAVREKLLANMMAPPVIELKKDAQVMLIKNMDETLVNGSLGTVVGFMNEATFELKANSDFDDDEDLDKKRRIKAFTSALSNAAIDKGDNTEYPLVRFHAVDGTRRDILCQPEDWKVELPTGEVQASRKQLPLILAWALSIHKAQGQTLERVKVDLGRVFEKGQAYVALSRATTQQGLQVLRFQKDKVMAHPRVVSFYNKLYSAESAVMKKTKVDQSITKFAYKTPSVAQTIARQQQRREVIDIEDEEERMAGYG